MYSKRSLELLEYECILGDYWNISICSKSSNDFKNNNNNNFNQNYYIDR